MTNEALNELLYQVTGIAMQVHSRLGPDHPEVAYHRALLQRLRTANLTVQDHPRLSLLDDSTNQTIIDYQGDLRVLNADTQALIELKSDPRGIQASDRRQVRAYLSVSPHDQAALLLNFGTPKLQHERVYARRGAV